MAALSAATVQEPNEISSPVYLCSVPDRQREGERERGVRVCVCVCVCVHVCVYVCVGGVISSCISHHPQRKKAWEEEGGGEGERTAEKNKNEEGKN